MLDQLLKIPQYGDAGTTGMGDGRTFGVLLGAPHKGDLDRIVSKCLENYRATRSETAEPL
jgi:hypothetical protein